MVHPHRFAVAGLAEAVEQRRFLRDQNVGAAEFAVMAALDLAAELFAHRHLAVADAEHRHAQLEHRLRRARRMRFGDAGRTAGEDDRLRRARGERCLRLVVGHDLAIDARFAHAPRDELGDLRAEIDDQNGCRHDRI